MKKLSFLLILLAILFITLPINVFAETYSNSSWEVGNNSLPYQSNYYNNFKFISFTQSSRNVNFSLWTHLNKVNNYESIMFNLSIYLSTSSLNFDYNMIFNDEIQTYNTCLNGDQCSDFLNYLPHFNAYTSVSSNTGGENLCSMELHSVSRYSYNYQVTCPTNGLSTIDDFNFYYKGSADYSYYITYMFSGKFSYLPKGTLEQTIEQSSQNIINNQDQNTQQQIESQNVCSFIDKANISTDGKYLTSNGGTTDNPTTGITDFIPVDSRSKLTSVSVFNNPYVYSCFYDVNKTLISCVSDGSMSVDTDISIPSNASFFRATIYTPTNRPTFKLCSNGNQALNNSLNSLNDTTQPNTNQDISDMDDMLASDTPISDLITMPLTLFGAYLNGVNSSCSSFNLGNLYGTDLILPCLNLEQRLGSNLWHIIDAFFSIFMCYNIGMLFISAFEGITSLRDDFDSLYQPRHADTGYQPKHGGGD